MPGRGPVVGLVLVSLVTMVLPQAAAVASPADFPLASLGFSGNSIVDGEYLAVLSPCNSAGVSDFAFTVPLTVASGAPVGTRYTVSLTATSYKANTLGVASAPELKTASVSWTHTVSSQQHYPLSDAASLTVPGVGDYDHTDFALMANVVGQEGASLTHYAFIGGCGGGKAPGPFALFCLDTALLAQSTLPTATTRTTNSGLSYDAVTLTKCAGGGGGDGGGVGASCQLLSRAIATSYLRSPAPPNADSEWALGGTYKICDDMPASTGPVLPLGSDSGSTSVPFTYTHALLQAPDATGHPGGGDYCQDPVTIGNITFIGYTAHGEATVSAFSYSADPTSVVVQSTVSIPISGSNTFDLSGTFAPSDTAACEAAAAGAEERLFNMQVAPWGRGPWPASGPATIHLINLPTVGPLYTLSGTGAGSVFFVLIWDHDAGYLHPGAQWSWSGTVLEAGRGSAQAFGDGQVGVF